MELMQRITIQFDDGDDDDAILSTRLACKTLEAATFDRFADRFFKHHQCCILYKRSLLRLHDLLESSSRLTARIRYITFTSCFFASARHKRMQLAPNQSDNDLESAQIAAMGVHARSEVEMLRKQSLPDPELMRRVFVVFMAKCPGTRCGLDLVTNVRCSIPVHADALQVISSLGTPLNFLAVNLKSLSSRVLNTLLSGLPACTASLDRFGTINPSKPSAEGDDRELSVAERRLLIGEKCSLLRSVLGSAIALRDLTLDLSEQCRRLDVQSILQLTSELLVASSHPILQSLRLGAMAVTEATLLKALASWGGQLKSVAFEAVYLHSVEGEGWSDVLSTLTTMPELRETRLYVLYMNTITHGRHLADLRHVKHGQVGDFHVADHRTHNSVVFRNRNEVTAGLRELLEGRLEYY